MLSVLLAFLFGPKHWQVHCAATDGAIALNPRPDDCSTTGVSNDLFWNGPCSFDACLGSDWGSSATGKGNKQLINTRTGFTRHVA